jgi:hypothetical protein
MIPTKALRLESWQENRREEIGAEINRRLEQQAADPRPKDYPKTAEEWWRNVDAWWAELLNLINMFNIRLSDLPPLKTGHMKPAGVVLEKMRAERNIELSNILETTWAAAPDNGVIHGLEAWGILCDLCSESHVLYPEPEPDVTGDTFDQRLA